MAYRIGQYMVYKWMNEYPISQSWSFNLFCPNFIPTGTVPSWTSANILNTKFSAMHTAMAQCLVGAKYVVYFEAISQRSQNLACNISEFMLIPISQVKEYIFILKTNHWLNRLVTIITLYWTSCGWNLLQHSRDGKIFGKPSVFLEILKWKPSPSQSATHTVQQIPIIPTNIYQTFHMWHELEINVKLASLTNCL